MMFGIEKPRILIFIGSLRSGGKERRLIELLSYLAAKDVFEILVVMTTDEIHYNDFYKLNINYKIIRKKWKRYDPTVFYQFYKVSRQFDPHIIHAWGQMQALYSIPVVIGQKRQLVNSQITGAPSGLKNWTIDRLIDSINFRFSRVVLANSKAGLEAFNPPKQKQKLIYNGINLARFVNLPPVEKVKEKYGITTPNAVVMIASFTPTKDYDLFFNVARKVTSIRDDISFIGVGGYDKDDSEYKRMLSLNPENKKIIFKSQIQDVEALVNACTIGVLFSTNGEGMSNSILEYMALGKPVIANNSGGTAELIRNGESGYLINNETVDEISDWIVKLVDNPEKCGTFGEISKKRIRESFSIDTMGKAFEKVYSDILMYEDRHEIIEPSIITNKV